MKVIFDRLNLQRKSAHVVKGRWIKRTIRLFASPWTSFFVFVDKGTGLFCQQRSSWPGWSSGAEPSQDQRRTSIFAHACNTSKNPTTATDLADKSIFPFIHPATLRRRNRVDGIRFIRVGGELVRLQTRKESIRG